MNRIKSVRLPNQHLIYIWYSLQSWAVKKKYLPLTQTPEGEGCTDADWNQIPAEA